MYWNNVTLVILLRCIVTKRLNHFFFINKEILFYHETLIIVFVIGIFFVFSILPKQWSINMPLENLKLTRRVITETLHFLIKKPDFNKQ